VRRFITRAILLGVFSVFAMDQSPAWADSGWSILDFDVRISINHDASIEVTETIDAVFHVAKHGILREIPVRYAVGVHQYALRVKLEEVSDGEGHDYESSVSHEDNLMRIRIGSPDFTVRGPKRYRLRYRVERAILWEGNHAWEQGDYAVLRWNATGTEWQVAIESAKVTVILPMDLNDSQNTYDAWTGSFGAREKNFSKRRVDGRTLEFTAGPLRPREGVTVEISMPSDAVVRPGWAKELSWWVVDNFPYAIFPATLAFCFFSWFLRGRDLPGMGSIVVNYEAPDGLSPAEVGTLVDEKVDLRDISASIIDLAVRGYLKIEEVKADSWFSSESDYRFIKLKGPEGLKSFEKKLFNKIFDDRDTVLLSELQERFFPVISQVRSDLYRRLSTDHFFDGNPNTVRGTFLVLGLLLMAAVLGAACLIQLGLIGRVFPVPVIVAGGLSALAMVITSRVMPRKTRKGRIAWEKIAGLQEFVFGLSKRWGKAFENLYREPPNWYQPANQGNFSTWMLVNDIDRSIWSMNQTLPSQPRVSTDGGGRGGGYSWSSGGFGGGGSSGGGFGGGGGSSW
jgi:hypothetical protein